MLSSLIGRKKKHTHEWTPRITISKHLTRGSVDTITTKISAHFTVDCQRCLRGSAPADISEGLQIREISTAQTPGGGGHWSKVHFDAVEVDREQQSEVQWRVVLWTLPASGRKLNQLFEESPVCPRRCWGSSHNTAFTFKLWRNYFFHLPRNEKRGARDS